MTDPGAPAGSQQQPDSAGDPQASGTADIPRDPADASPHPDPGEGDACGPAAGTGESASRFKIAPDFQTGQIYDDLAQQLDDIYDVVQQVDDIADTVALARSAYLASITPKISIASAFPTPVFDSIANAVALAHSAYLASTVPRISIAATVPTAATAALTAISKMAALPDLGLLKVLTPAVSLAASFSEPVIPRYVFPALPDPVFLHGVSALLNSWDHGLLGVSRQVAENAAALAGRHRALIDSVAGLAPIRAGLLGPLADLVAGNVTSGLVGLFQSWRETAETGLEMLRGLARAAYGAARRARKAVLDGDDGPVAWFIEAWLCMRATPRRIEAVSAALLEDGWDAGIPEDADCLLTDLRSRTRRQTRVLKPLWETQINHQLIGTLDRTVTGRDGKPLTIADLVPHPQTTEDLVLAGEYQEPRISLVLARLKPDERQITSIYAQSSELTWADAARLSGAADPQATGERVRRKVKRIGAEHSRRLVLAGGA